MILKSRMSVSASASVKKKKRKKILLHRCCFCVMSISTIIQFVSVITYESPEDNLCKMLDQVRKKIKGAAALDNRPSNIGDVDVIIMIVLYLSRYGTLIFHK